MAVVARPVEQIQALVMLSEQYSISGDKMADIRDVNDKPVTSPSKGEGESLKTSFENVAR
ncbi:hypothetical protein [Vibrio cortegadensis]|uniref:hypothetical protein n=1 Tax=Vibrio cortegadensis TaxID=1328770 RepID=UPI0021C277E5|nr:hypothetical protein [Vibrio cortegadensis]